MRDVAALVAAGVVLLGLAGCRSDGGIDRTDLRGSRQFALQSLADRTDEDADHTVHRIASIPRAIGEEFERAGGNLASTWALYLEGASPR